MGFTSSVGAFILKIDTENADFDLTAQKTVLTYESTYDVPIKCMGRIAVGDGTKDRAATSDDWELTLVVEDQGIEPAPQTITVGTLVRSGHYTEEFILGAGETVLFKLKSPTGGDTDVDVTADLFQIG